MHTNGTRLVGGVGRATITPPVGLDIVGYGMRVDPSTHIHDDLMATSLVLSDGDRKLVIVACDLVALVSPDVDELRRAAGEIVGEPAARVMIACSHTHAGPVTSPGFKLMVTGESALTPAERAYVENLRNQILGAVAEANGRRRVPLPPRRRRQHRRSTGAQRQLRAHGAAGHRPGA